MEKGTERGLEEKAGTENVGKEKKKKTSQEGRGDIEEEAGRESKGRVPAWREG